MVSNVLNTNQLHTIHHTHTHTHSPFLRGWEDFKGVRKTEGGPVGCETENAEFEYPLTGRSLLGVFRVAPLVLELEKKARCIYMH